MMFLKEHPELGFTTTLTGAVQSFIETSTPYLQYIALLLGLAIGLLTLIVKLIDLKNKFKNKKQ